MSVTVFFRIKGRLFFSKKFPDSIESSTFVSHRAGMSGQSGKIQGKILFQRNYDKDFEYFRQAKFQRVA